MLQAWLFLTRYASWPVTILSRRLHTRMGADPSRFAERLGRVGPSTKGKVIWFHAASLGEVKQIGPLAAQLKQDNNTNILVTTATLAGADWVAAEMPFAQHRYVPLDTPKAVNTFLDAWTIAAAIFVEGDLWPRLVLETQQRDIPMILLNARHSRTRARFHRSFSTLLAPFALATCRSQTVAEDLQALGIPANKLHVLPDLRVSVQNKAPDQTLTTALSTAIGTRPHWLAASTHAADENAVLTAHTHVQKAAPDTLLIVAPRHPKRGPVLRKLAQDMGFTVSQRSQGEEITPETQVYIVDTLGELDMFFAVSPVVFLGGSFGNEGGHNPYEPAQFGSAILYGPNVKNFADAFDAMTRSGGALKVEEAQLGETVANLLGSDQSKAMAAASIAYMAKTQENVSTSAELIQQVIAQSDKT